MTEYKYKLTLSLSRKERFCMHWRKGWKRIAHESVEFEDGIEALSKYMRIKTLK